MCYPPGGCYVHHLCCSSSAAVSLRGRRLLSCHLSSRERGKEKKIWRGNTLGPRRRCKKRRRLYSLHTEWELVGGGGRSFVKRRRRRLSFPLSLYYATLPGEPHSNHVHHRRAFSCVARNIYLRALPIDTFGAAASLIDAIDGRLEPSTKVFFFCRRDIHVDTTTCQSLGKLVTLVPRILSQGNRNGKKKRGRRDWSRTWSSESRYRQTRPVKKYHRIRKL